MSDIGRRGFVGQLFGGAAAMLSLPQIELFSKEEKKPLIFVPEKTKAFTVEPPPGFKGMLTDFRMTGPDGGYRWQSPPGMGHMIRDDEPIVLTIGDRRVIELYMLSQKINDVFIGISQW